MKNKHDDIDLTGVLNFTRRKFIRAVGLSSFIYLWGCNNEQQNITQINIKNFEAKGDGLSDDTHALLYALQYLKDIGGGILYVPAGRYLISNSVQFGVFRHFENIEIVGEGDSSVFVLCKGSISFGGFTDFTLKNLKFVRDVNETNRYREKHQINMSSFEGLIIDNVTFDDFGPTDTNFPIPGSTILFLYAGLKTGSVTSPDIISGNSKKFKLLNSRFYAGGDRTVNFGVRIYTEFVVEETATMIDGVISKCTLNGFNWNAVEIAGPQTKFINVDNCKVLSGGLTGVEVDKGASYCRITKCEFHNLSGNIDVSIYPNTAISGVVLQGDITNGLVGEKNLIEDVKVYLTDTALEYPNNIHGISVVDAEHSTIRDVTVVVSSQLKEYATGSLISIFVSGKYSGNLIENCYLSRFEYGVYVKNMKSICAELPIFHIINVDFSSHLNISSLPYGDSELCNVMIEGATFTA